MTAWNKYKLIFKFQWDMFYIKITMNDQSECNDQKQIYCQDKNLRMIYHCNSQNCTYRTKDDINCSNTSLVLVRNMELRNQLSTVQTSIISNGCWDTQECPRKCLHCKRFFSSSFSSQCINFLCHYHFRPPASK